MTTNARTAVVVAWRTGENDLNATLESARASAGTGALILPIEDTEGAGPARTRHCGIEQAPEADVVILIDAHMRFEGDTLARMAAHVREHGGLLCALCCHNAECSFDAGTARGASHYAGARIEYKGDDGNGRAALVVKWATDTTPGPRPCVCGACYAFRREWYFDVGAPLAALPGWGCDEEALSISAWLSGHMPEVFPGRVAHRWRPAAPWSVTPLEVANVRLSRAALLSAVVADPGDLAELRAWQNATAYTSPEVERWRVALLKLPRTWAQWKSAFVTATEPTPAPAPAPAPARPPAPPPRPRFVCASCGYAARFLTGDTVERCPECGAMNKAFGEVEETTPARSGRKARAK